jgi:hypothetical protein
MSKLIPVNFRPKEERLTQKRVEMIMQYIIYCYDKMLSDGKKYSKSAKLNLLGTKYNLEEYLNEKLVEDYLGNSDNRQFYKENISDSKHIDLVFNCESKQTYTENEIRKDDFIDIKVNETELSDIWGKAGIKEQIHLAIECKIIENGYSEYVSDIEKMCARKFNTLRLPFEGQIAYMNNSKYTHNSVSNGIKNNLSNHRKIKTNQPLIQKSIKNSFKASYLSKHFRNHNNEEFSIYHLLFDYSNIIIN